MKKIISIIIFGLLIGGNAYANKPVYIELICAPDTQWEDAYTNTKKIWFPSFKPKFLIHMDLDKMKVVKVGYSKNEDEIRDVSIPIEEKFVDVNYEYRFIKSGSLNENLNVFNIITVLSGRGMDGLFVVQYQLNSEVTSFIMNEMKNDTASEFERAMKKYSDKNLTSIMSSGGLSTVECKGVRKYK